ncbi:RNA polymerase sigma factor (sigma-70 family) [Virgibacillus natechei]|uniref:RNA polymerase sigma factor (Sigma-70 family) n=1 Tax=Virgibacillus natechei TaxID=1216297 RepID=A0ABS4IIK5_9BACI|nr:sigma-70 family RNA polymerase sigma factor [Virgibacillus natechei]MBP1970757.1 RNA polymerase sigma factor (sigma-70 family) [Virgibacillus natechei]UZD12334.1 sigma-70 family RNA polymerase sigma factor [Virgibacillus natechei]
MSKDNVTFEEIFKQNERRIHYYIHRLNIRDPHQEFYTEGLVAMWNAYEKYQPDKGPMATYFNYTIRNRMIDLMRKENKQQENLELYKQEQKTRMDDGNHYRSGGATYPVMKVAESESTLYDLEFWKEVRTGLSDNQWKWVTYFVIEDMSVKEIAEQEGVSVEAVKSWGKEVRRKLRGRVSEKKLELI